MKVSYKWLKNLVDIEGISAEEISDKLTFAGVEVEDITTLASATGLVIGKTLEVENMPNSDHLHICKVDLGSKYGVLQIVCGAPNVAPNEKVIVATDGAKLPGGTIKKGMIRGYESNGMLCSLSELGVDNKYLSEEQLKGIELLSDDAEVGNENVLEYLGLDDQILDLSLLANRSDLMSMNNVAREVATLFNRETNIEVADVKSTKTYDFKVGSETDSCYQFSGRVIEGIKVKESPKWMQEYLRSMGVRSINNIVDIGNYIMLLTGQPLHMYDLDKLPGKNLIARDDYEGEFVALDEKSYSLQKGDIVITSNGKPMCLGGVMGSLECAVDEKTTSIVIEAAQFKFSNVRKTSNRLGLVSESSQRFVKGLNPYQYDYVLDLTTKVVKDLCGCTDIGEISTYDKNAHSQTVITTSVEKINNRLGTHFTKDEIVEVLTRDHMGIETEGNKIIVTVPYYRIDMTCDADVSEEVIRLLGFENVDSELPTLSLTVGGMKENVAKKRLVRDYLRGTGLDEVVTYTLVRKEDIQKFAFVTNDEAYNVLHPLTDEHEYVRTNLMHSLLQAASFNYSRQNKNLNFFEVSDIDTKATSQIHLGVVLVGYDMYQGAMRKIPYSFYTMKGYLEGVMSILNIEPNRYTIERIPDAKGELHPYKSAQVRIGKDVVAVFGEIHPSKIKEYDLGKEPVILMEVRLDKLFEIKSSKKKFVAPNKFPSVTRDIAIIIKNDISAAEVINVIKKADRSIIKDAVVFDEYKGEHLEPGYKSLALSITYSSNESTLKDEQITVVEQKVLSDLEKAYLAKLR